MALQKSTAVRNAEADVVESTIGTAPILQFWSGAQPANCAAADTGTKLAEMTLPSDWLAAASSGSKSKLGTWQDASADATGTLGHWRLKDSGGTTCHLQGSVTATGGGGDITVASTSITSGQPFTITSFSYAEGNS